MASEPRRRRAAASQIQTLLISGAAAVVAATVVPMIWERGTVLATAMTPIIVALVSEALRKPVETVTAGAAEATGARTAVRRQRAAPADARARPGARGEAASASTRCRPRSASTPRVADDDPFGLRAGAAAAPVAAHRR